MRKNFKKWLIALVTGAAIAGAVLVGCGLFKSGIETNDFTLGGFNADPSPAANNYNSVYKVDTKCIIAIDKGDIDKTPVTDTVDGGGYVTGSGCVSKKEVPGSPIEYKNITLEPKALDGYEFGGLTYNIGNSWQKADATHTKIIVTTKPKPANYTDPTGELTIWDVNSNIGIYFWFSKNNYEFNFSLSPSSGRIEVVSNTFGSNFTTGSSKVSINLGSSIPDEGGNIKIQVSGIDSERYSPPANITKDISVRFLDPESGGLVMYDLLKDDPNFKDMLVSYKKNNDSGFTIEFHIAKDQFRDITAVLDLMSVKDKSQYNYRCQIITMADPDEAGTTSGDTQNLNPVTNNISAIAKPGYKFAYWSWYENGQLKINDANTFLASSSGVTIFTAHFVKEAYKVELASIVPQDSGRVTGTGVYKLNEPITITFTPNDGYRLAKWSYTTEKTGVTYSGENSADGEQTIEICAGITENISLHVDFTSTKVEVNTVASPSNGGTAKLIDPPSGTGHETKDEYPRGSTVSMKATAASGYKFLYWSDSNGDQYTTADLSIPNISQNLTYTAHFVNDSLSISVIATPAGAGQVKLNDSEYQDSIDANVNAEDDITLTARETTSAYHFDHWEIIESGKENKTVTKNPMTVLDVTSTKGHIRYVAVFVPNLATLKVLANPAAGGTVLIDGAYTELSVAEGDEPVLRATSNEDYYFDYWEDSKGNRYSGETTWYSGVEINTLKLKFVQSDETYTAHFIPWSVAITYQADPYEAGKVDCNGHGYEAWGTQNELGGWQVTLTARPNNAQEYKFDHWEDDLGNKYNGNPLELPKVRRDTIFTAVFVKYSKQDSGGIIVYASPAAGGYVSKVYNDDGTVTIKATPNKGYTFSCWKHDKVVISRKKETVIESYSDGDEFVAYFVATGGEIIRTGLVDEHFYRDKRHVTNPVYTFDRNKLTFLAKAQIDTDKKKNDTPALKKYEAYDNAALYYEQHMQDNQFIFVDGELVTTKGEKMPIDYIPASEEEFADFALEFTNKKFGDRYDTEIIAAVDVTMPTGFEDGTRTYLWRNTGGRYKDNIYLLYATSYTSEYTWVTGVVDIDESIRFTVDDPGRMVRLAAVRVKIDEDPMINEEPLINEDN